MRKIGILYHPKRASAQPLAVDLEREIRAMGTVEVWVTSAWNENLIMAKAPGSDMVITLGGDGTILRAARAVAPLDVPILAVNLGKLGFMAECGPRDVFAELPSFLEGKAWVEERLMLHAEFQTMEASRIARSVDGQVPIHPHTSLHALNEVVVARSDRVRVINVRSTIDGVEGPTYVADGVIVATPTGSTGYSLSVGGPVLQPELRNVIMAPIAPHLSIAKSLVFPVSVKIELEVKTDHGAVLSIDGQIDVPLQDGDRITVTRSPYVTKLLRVQPRNYFYKTFATRLKLGETRC